MTKITPLALFKKVNFLFLPIKLNLLIKNNTINIREYYSFCKLKKFYDKRKIF